MLYTRMSPSGRLPALRVLTLLALVAPLGANSVAQTTQTLLATPSTVAWGYYWAKAKPALTVHSGDTVVIQTLSTCGPPERLEALGVKAADIPAYTGEIYAKVPKEDRGPGGHILTGPIAIAEAEPGDILEVRIQKIQIDVPFACNSFGPGRGFLPNDFPYGRTKIIPLDRTAMTGDFAPGITLPLHPFFGSMGIAPPEGAGRYNSAPPWMHAGNMDNKELVAGTTLFLPVHAPGALFEAGDGHAGQGNGEVDITALETYLTGTFQFIVHKGSLSDPHRLLWPRAETPTQYIAMGFDEDLKLATEMAVHNMITFLSEQNPDHPHLSREDAYSLISVACDVDITQLVDTKSGVHVMCPKNIFSK
ncbi:acetamidase/formamidase family protein [Granulicella arctica]|uniref:Acetamidase/formamidase n=1 Tax=Granulicella arctica TaxID=940613 RepID=A0A7Y9TI37_9BACT|nr:acetamidase/formamidase family protein [Granulicella arctica]NYF81189.1 acetamidase/formamidase [Granulicella arctica]